MDFKQPNRYPNGQPRLNVPQRQRGSSHPAPSTISHQSTTPSKPLKKVDLSFIRRLFSTKKALAISTAVIVFGGAGLLIYRHYVDMAAQSIDLATAPTYHTVSPGGEAVSELGGWKRVTPLDKSPVFAYDDSIDGVSISVSQQPLPNSFRSDTGNQVAELAKNYSATDKITAGDTTVYIGTSIKGPQSVILSKEDLLVLIKSQKVIDDTAWAQYIKSLKPSGRSTLPKF